MKLIRVLNGNLGYSIRCDHSRKQIIVPCIMLALFVYSLVIAGSVQDSEQKTSAWAGFWAGQVLFVVYVVSQLSLLRDPDLGSSRLPDFLIVPMGLGLVIGFLFLWMVKATVPTRLVGLITLLLSAVSSSALFTYIFVNSLRVAVLYWALGTALGILLHIVFFPASVRDLFD